MENYVLSGASKLQSICKGCKSFNFTMQEPCSWYSAIKFRNNNSYSVTILFQCEEDSSWEVIMSEYELMSSPHVRSRSCEAWVVLPCHSWLHKCAQPCSHKHKVRVIVKQPSPHWKQFGIQHFNFIHVNQQKNPTETSSTLSCREVLTLSS